MKHKYILAIIIFGVLFLLGRCLQKSDGSSFDYEPLLKMEFRAR